VSTNVGSPYYDAAGIPHSTRKAFSNRGPAGPITYSDTSYTLYRLDGSGNILVSTVTGPLFVYQSESRTDTRTETSKIQPAIRTYGCAAYPEQTTTVTREGTYTRSYVGTGGYANPVDGAPSNKFTHTDSDITDSVTAVANVWSLTTTTIASTIEDVEPLVFGSTTTVATTVPGLSTSFVEGAIPREFDDRIPLKAAKTAAMAAIAAENLFEGACPGSGAYRSNVCESSYAQTVRPIAGYGDFLTAAYASKVRYRWKIPSTHLGSYFKIIYDIIEEPDGWDINPPVPPVRPDTVSDPGAEPVELITNPAHVVWENAAEAWANAWDPPADAPPYPEDEPSEEITNPAYNAWLAASDAYDSYLAAHDSYLADVVVYDEAVIAWAAYLEDHPEWVARPRFYDSQDNEVKWTGPGNPEDSEDESWLSDFYYLEPPDAPGDKRIVNVRYECYRSSKFGQKPQLTGEQVELDLESPAVNAGNPGNPGNPGN
jgi:hypothetical protein